MKRRIGVLLLAALLLVGCGAKETEPDFGPEVPPEVDLEPIEVPKTAEPEMPPVSESDPRAATVEKLLAEMSLEEKVGQMFFARCPDVGAVEKIQEFHLGGYLLFGRDFQDKTAEEVMEMIASYQRAAAVPLLIGADEEGGTVVRLSRNPALFPEKFQSPQKVFKRGGWEAIGQDAARKSTGLLGYGVNVNLAPVADVSTNPEDFIYSRTFGQAAAETAEFVRVVTEEMGKAGIGAVLKHFPGYGDNVDTHTGIAVDERPYSQFLEEDFLPFQAGIDAGAGAVLVSHNIATCMDEILPASLSPEVHRVLREELGFTGVIMTDDLDMDAVEAYAKDGSVAALAVAAGNDMIVTGDFERRIPLVVEAVRTGLLDESRVDEAVRRILGWKYDLGLIG